MRIEVNRVTGLENREGSEIVLASVVWGSGPNGTKVLRHGVCEMLRVMKKTTVLLAVKSLKSL